MEEEAYGPELPSWISKKSESSKKSSKNNDSSLDDDAYGPSLPPHLLSTPSQSNSYNVPLPPSYTNKACRDSPTKVKVKGNINDLSDEFCPDLPPHLKNRNKVPPKAVIDPPESDVYFAALPPHLIKSSKVKMHEKESDIYSAALPPHLIKKCPENQMQAEDDACYGAELPPHLKNKSKESVLGPAKPANLHKLVQDNFNYNSHSNVEDDDESDDCVVGPLPSATKIDLNLYNQQQIELRAQKMKDKMTGKGEEKKLERESWMMELPDGRPNLLGLATAPRQFRKKAVELGDRSVWTDSPQDKERKSKMGKDASKSTEDSTPELIASKKRDEQLTDLVADYNSRKRGSALIDMHKDKIKKKNEEHPSNERRPFSREVDLNVNKFDEAQKSAILKKARDLDDRFSAGGKRFL